MPVNASFLCLMQALYSTGHSITVYLGVFFCKRKHNAIPFFFFIFSSSTPPPFLQFQFISNQRATDNRPTLITPLFACLHINDCRLCCFSAAAVPSHTIADLTSPHAATLGLSLSFRTHTLSLRLTDIQGRTFHYQSMGGNR